MASLASTVRYKPPGRLKLGIIPFDVIVYHKGCSDGIMAAWVFWSHARFCKQFPRLVPASHGHELPINLKRWHRVVIVDFCYSRPQLLCLAALVKEVYIFDHHLSNVQVLQNLDHPKIVSELDTQKCGAQLAFNYVYDTNLWKPWQLDMIADRDLGHFTYPYTALSAACYHGGFLNSVESVDTLMRYQGYQDFLHFGLQLLHKEAHEVKLYCQQAVKTTCVLGSKTYTVIVCSPPHTLKSAVGRALLHQYPDADFVCLYTYIPSDQHWRLSFRSHGAFDLTSITPFFPNSGGSKHAAGATLYEKGIWDIFIPVENK